MILKTYKLGEITTKIGSGVTPRGGEKVYQDSGVALIRSQNIYDYQFETDGLVFINDEIAGRLSVFNLPSLKY
jgi:type I restriction enzyme, S subunit